MGSNSTKIWVGKAVAHNFAKRLPELRLNRIIELKSGNKSTRMTSIIGDAYVTQLSAQEPWPDDVKLYQPYEADQILLPDFASCLSVKTFLKICRLPFEVERRTNAEQMSPSGKLPFVHAGSMVVSEFEPIVRFVQAKGVNLSAKLTPIQQADMKAYMALVENTFVKAELYTTWLEEDDITTVTKERYGSPYTWPLNKILPLKTQYHIKSYLKSCGWACKSYQEVCDEVNVGCQALKERLGDQQFFFGNQPTELDALAYGHLQAILTFDWPLKRLQEPIKKCPTLLQFCKRINDVYIKQRGMEGDH